MQTLAQIETLFRENGGLLRTGQLMDAGLFYPQIRELTEQGILEKVRYGCYRYAEQSLPQGALVAKLFPDAVLCLQSACYVYGYCDFLSDEWHLAVSKDSSKSRFQLDYPFVKPYYTEPALLSVGVTEREVDGGQFRLTDRDRTAVDVLRYRNKLPAAFVREVLARYAADSEKNLAKFNEYAGICRLAESAKATLWMLLEEETV